MDKEPISTDNVQLKLQNDTTYKSNCIKHLEEFESRLEHKQEKIYVKKVISGIRLHSNFVVDGFISPTTQRAIYRILTQEYYKDTVVSSNKKKSYKSVDVPLDKKTNNDVPSTLEA